MKIVKIGDLHRLLYVSRNQTPGLTDITAKCISPTKAVTTIPWSGIDPLVGWCELGQGIYYHDWNTASRAAGLWAFMTDSASKPAAGADAAFLIDGDTLDNTPWEKLDTMLDSALAALSTITSKVDLVQQDVTTVGSNVSTIKGLAEGSSGFVATKSVVDAIQTAIGQISNSTKNTWSTPAEVVIPSSGSINRRIYMNIFDENGNMEDPDLDHIEVVVRNAAGADVSASFLSGSAPFFMTKDAVGQYHIDYTIESTDTAQVLAFQHIYAEGGKAVVRTGAVEVVASLSADIQTSLTNLSNQIDGVEDKVDAETVLVNAIKAVTDNLPDGGLLTSIAKDATVAKASVLGTPVHASIALDIAEVLTRVNIAVEGVLPGGYMI